MKKLVKTGMTPLPIATVAAILSLSLVVNLPGLAVSPMLEKISDIFPDSSELEVQLLTLLPNLLIIPFVLLSGTFSVSRHKYAIIITGLVIFTASAIAYLFATSMAGLIIPSCTLGAGAGILVPFSTGLIADNFSGPYCMREMGLQSGIANLTLVVATFIVGWLQHANWHLPFVVYFVVLIPLVFAPWLRTVTKRPASSAAGDDSNPDKPVTVTYPDDVCPSNFRKNGFSYGRLAGICSLYFMVTSLTIVISYYSPFLVNHRGWGESITGTVTALFFLFIFIPGFFLNPILKFLKNRTIHVCLAIIAAGLALYVFCPTRFTLCLGAMLCGFGYGVIQPVMYDKATRTVNQPSRATLSLSILLAANYIAIVITPFFIDEVMRCIHLQSDFRFPFMFNLVLSVIVLVTALLFRRRFALYISPALYGEPAGPESSDCSK